MFFTTQNNQKQDVPMKRIIKQLLNVKNVKVLGARTETEQNGDKTVVFKVEPTKGQRCRCPVCGKKVKFYDKGKGPRRWRALDFAAARVYIESESPRVKCREHGVLAAKVPWARQHSTFTRDFEDTVAWMGRHLCRSAVAEYMRVAWNTVGPIISRCKKDADPNPGHRFDGLKRIGIDETSYKKGHKYITVIVNHDTNSVIWVHEKHGKEVLKLFLEELTPEQRASIECYSADGARWISETMGEYCPKAERCLDSFHLVEWANESLDKVRAESWQNARKKEEERGRGSPKKGEGKDRAAKTIKGSMYALGKAPENLTEGQKAKLDYIANTDKRLYRAYCLKESLRTLIKLSPDEIAENLKGWLWKASHSRIPAIYELQKKIRRHVEAIKNTAKHHLSNARIEATNNKIKLSIRMAYGFRNIGNMLDLIMLRCSDIPIFLPGRA